MIGFVGVRRFIFESLKTNEMTIQEIYNLANKMTEQEAQNVINNWTGEDLRSCLSLITLGDSKQLAVATTIANKVNSKGCTKEFYYNAYCL